MKKFNILKFLGKYNPFEWVGVAGLAVMLVVAFGNVLSRYVLPVSWAFTEELTCGLFILVSLLGAALAIIKGKAMGISILTDHVPDKYQKYVVIIQGAAMFVFSALLFYYGCQMVKGELKIGMKTAALEWPEAVFGSFIPIGGFALMIASVVYIIKGVSNFSEKENAGEKGEEEK